jgi:GNAT superfamily N-acetyltransferase
VIAAEIRERADDDLTNCARALRRVHEADSYPLVWPADPERWLAPRSLAAAWVAVSPDLAECGGIVGHVLLREDVDPDLYELARLFVTPSGRGLRLGESLIAQAEAWAAQHGRQLMLEVTGASERSYAAALYERTGWRKVGTSTADWTAPDGSPVQMQRYVR